MDVMINWTLILPILVLQLVLAVIGLISLSKAQMVRGPKWMWVLIIVIGNMLGSILYFIVGRKDM
ncbi:PLDc N-terminal domain-containing protein [Paenibacillus crassostreae]|uniref:Transcriptional regulator n=1 Tax=Paenibacillus crassostreae TaxID=1763538 RepID=A0A167ESU1_9BACL|nr:PLDc N-terminal domain-containing protein [Paenibacillus crassostreae]AOZ93496.1 transcriptional regulator [Paenibacillus crassostreae]OAB75849.1 transcriptional regulator [Paenibacillus crassostreae]